MSVILSRAEQVMIMENIASAKQGEVAMVKDDAVILAFESLNAANDAANAIRTYGYKVAIQLGLKTKRGYICVTFKHGIN